MRVEQNEYGYSLIELIIVILIMGVSLPAIISLYGRVVVHSAKSSVIDQTVAYAEEKMEEIIGFKENNWDWYKNPTRFVSSESLGEHFTRKVQVRKITNWGNARIEAWQVQVTVNNPQLPKGFTLTTRLTKYNE